MAELGDGDDLLAIHNFNPSLQGISDITTIAGGGGTDQLTMSGSPFKNMQRTGWEFINGVASPTLATKSGTNGLTFSLK